MYYAQGTVSFLFPEKQEDRPNLLECSIATTTESADVAAALRTLALEHLDQRKFRYSGGVLAEADLIETRVAVTTVSINNFIDGVPPLVESTSRVDYVTW